MTTLSKVWLAEGIIKPDESQWDLCPGCGEPIDPLTKVWITELPDQKFYHIDCGLRLRATLLKLENND